MAKDHIHWRLGLTDADNLFRYLAEEIESLAGDADGTADTKLGFCYRMKLELSIAVDQKDDQ